MPIYEYVCGACKHEFEELTSSMANRTVPQCPACGTSSVERKVSVFAARQNAGQKMECGQAEGPCGECPGSSGQCPFPPGME